MTTQQVADRYYELAKENKWMDIQGELYSQDVVNIEPEHAVPQGIPHITRGLAAVQAKSAARREMMEALHSQECSAPVTGGKYFSMSMSREVTFKGKPRMRLDEIAVFEVVGDKIVTEQFFY